MSGVRVLVGTRKGAFILTSDAKRAEWEVSGPYFAGWEIYHLKGSPVDPNRLYASQSTGWFGQLIQRSDDGGKTWEPVSNALSTRARPAHQWFDGTQHPWEFNAVASEPSRRPGHGLRRRRGRRAVSQRRRREYVARTAGLLEAKGHRGSRARAGWACTIVLTRRAKRIFVPSPLLYSQRRRRADVATYESRLRSNTNCGPGRRGRPLRPQYHHAPLRRTCSS